MPAEENNIINELQACSKHARWIAGLMLGLAIFAAFMTGLFVFGYSLSQYFSINKISLPAIWLWGLGILVLGLIIGGCLLLRSALLGWIRRVEEQSREVLSSSEAVQQIMTEQFAEVTYQGVRDPLLKAGDVDRKTVQRRISECCRHLPSLEPALAIGGRKQNKSRVVGTTAIFLLLAASPLIFSRQLDVIDNFFPLSFLLYMALMIFIPGYFGADNRTFVYSYLLPEEILRRVKQ